MGLATVHVIVDSYVSYRYRLVVVLTLNEISKIGLIREKIITIEILGSRKTHGKGSRKLVDFWLDDSLFIELLVLR